MSNSFKDAIDHLHDNVFLLLRSEFISFFLSYLNLSILVSFKKQNFQRKQAGKDSGSWRGNPRVLAGICEFHLSYF